MTDSAKSTTHETEKSLEEVWNNPYVLKPHHLSQNGDYYPAIEDWQSENATNTRDDLLDKLENSDLWTMRTTIFDSNNHIVDIKTGLTYCTDITKGMTPEQYEVYAEQLILKRLQIFTEILDLAETDHLVLSSYRDIGCSTGKYFHCQNAKNTIIEHLLIKQYFIRYLEDRLIEFHQRMISGTFRAMNYDMTDKVIDYVEVDYEFVEISLSKKDLREMLVSLRRRKRSIDIDVTNQSYVMQRSYFQKTDEA